MRMSTDLSIPCAYWRTLNFRFEMVFSIFCDILFSFTDVISSVYIVRYSTIGRTNLILRKSLVERMIRWWGTQGLFYLWFFVLGCHLVFWDALLLRLLKYWAVLNAPKNLSLWWFHLTKRLILIIKYVIKYRTKLALSFQIPS